MKDDINLLVKKHEDKKKKNLFFLISASTFVIIFIISAAVLLVSLALSARVSSLQEEESALQNQISSLSLQKARLLSLSERLQTIDTVINSRKTISERASLILDLISENFQINNFVVDGANVDITFSSPDLLNFDSLFEGRIPIFAKDKPFGLANIEVRSFTQSERGYTALLAFVFEQPNEK